MPPPPPPPPPKRGGAPLRPPGAAVTSSAKRPPAPIAASHTTSSPTSRIAVSVTTPPPKTASATSTTEKSSTGCSSAIAKATVIPRDATVTAAPTKPVVGTSQQESSNISLAAVTIPTSGNACNWAPNALATAASAPALPKKEGQAQQTPPCVAAAALFSQSAIACWRTEYLASLAMVVGQVGERLNRMGMGHKYIGNSKKQNPNKKPAVTKPKTNGNNETNDQKMSSSSSPVVPNKAQADKARKSDTVAPGTRSAALRAKHLASRKRHRTASSITPSRICSDLKRHYVSLLRGGLARAPEQPMATDGGPCIGERLLTCAAPSSRRDVEVHNSIYTDAAGGNAMSFRADDVALFNGPTYVLTTSCSSTAPLSTAARPQIPKAPIESLTKLVLERQLALKRLSVPPQPSANSIAALSIRESNRRSGGPNSAEARRRKLVKLALVGRREIDRALKTSSGPDGTKHARKENGRRGQKKRRRIERAKRTARK